MQTRFGIVIATALLLAALPATAGGTHGHDFLCPPHCLGGSDFVRGTATVELPPPFGPGPSSLHVNAGGSHHGSVDAADFVLWRKTSGGSHVRGDLLCLEAIGHEVVFTAVVTDSTSPLVPPGSGLQGRIIDNGEGGSRVDEATLVMTSTTGSTGACPTGSLATNPVERGNYVVHDGDR